MRLTFKYIFFTNFICIIVVSFFLLIVFKWNKSKFVSNSIDKPKIIGIGAGYVLDTSKDSKYGYLYDKQFIRTRYAGQFVKACKNKNVSFVVIPVDENQIDKIVDTIDGMIFTGGDDMNPKFFNQSLHPSVTDLEPDKRVDFDLKLIKKLTKKNKPIMGICLGMQEINVAFGGDVIQDIPSYFPNSNFKHKGVPVLEYAHPVAIKEGSFLHNILQTNAINVDSNHHQAVGTLADNFVVTAVSPDGVVEAIECKNCNNLVLGLQWHPDYLMDEYNTKIIQSFCDAVLK